MLAANARMSTAAPMFKKICKNLPPTSRRTVVSKRVSMRAMNSKAV